MRYLLTPWVAGWLVLFPTLVCAQQTSRLDESRLQRAGIRKIAGKHLDLYTDLSSTESIDQLPTVFDAAVPLWAEYFQIPQERIEDWRIRGFLIQDRAKFAAQELLPKQWPEFPNGFATPFEIWLMEQPSNYYRRHLMLHEGTHAFMHALLGGTGPGWYMEGMAELFGTHSWNDKKLQMRTMPKDRASVPMWGRIKLIREAYEAGEAFNLEAVLKMDGQRAMNTGQYAWCWSLCKFLDSHPRWQKKFRQLSDYVSRRRFNNRFREMHRADWPELLVEWRTFVADLDYGYAPQGMVMTHRRAQSPTAGDTFQVASQQSWQSTGWLLEKGKAFEITATGRYTIAQEEKPWPCEPGGVTLEYHGGHPLGMLMGAWRSPENDFSEPFPIGLRTVVRPPQASVLYLRVNDSPAKRFDNQGFLTARIDSPASRAD